MLTTEQFAGLIIMLIAILALLAYNAWLKHTLDNQTMVIQDLVFENVSLKQTNSLLRGEVGKLTDRLQVAEFETWGAEASTD